MHTHIPSYTSFSWYVRQTLATNHTTRLLNLLTNNTQTLTHCCQLHCASLWMWMQLNSDTHGGTKKQATKFLVTSSSNTGRFEKSVKCLTVAASWLPIISSQIYCRVWATKTTVVKIGQFLKLLQKRGGFLFGPPCVPPWMWMQLNCKSSNRARCSAKTNVHDVQVPTMNIHGFIIYATDIVQSRFLPIYIYIIYIKSEIKNSWQAASRKAVPPWIRISCVNRRQRLTACEKDYGQIQSMSP